MADFDATFKVGDVVRLLSGGPTMTVDRVRDVDGVVETVWFHEGLTHRDAFTPIQLMHEPRFQVTYHDLVRPDTSAAPAPVVW